MKKYFVKYVELYSIPSHPNSPRVRKTKFFNTEDIEQEWKGFKRLCKNSVELVDITPLN